MTIVLMEATVTSFAGDGLEQEPLLRAPQQEQPRQQEQEQGFSYCSCPRLSVPGKSEPEMVDGQGFPPEVRVGAAHSRPRPAVLRAGHIGRARSLSLPGLERAGAMKGERMYRDIWYKVINWLIFTVVIGLSPIIFYFILATLNSGSMPIPADAFANGELLLLSAMISSSAIGILFSGKFQKTIIGLLALGGSVLSLLLSTFSYAVSSAPLAALMGKTIVQPGAVAWLSFFCFP